MLELDNGVCGRKKECVGAGISEGEPPWAHEAGGRTLDPRAQVLAPPAVFSVPDILKYSRKNLFNLQGIRRTFIFRVFFIAWIIQKTNRQYYFTLFNLNNRK